jgi:16S rRNA (cytosine967-C5)-methyltransferase
MTITLADSLATRKSLDNLWGQFRAEVQRRQGQVPALDKWLESTFRQNPKFGKRDRREIRDSFFAVFRYLESLLIVVDGKTSSDSRRLPSEIVTRAVGLEWSEIARAWPQISAFESGYPRYGIPQYYETALNERAQKSNWSHTQFEKFVQLQSKPSPMWIRVNTLRISPGELCARLLAEQFPVRIAERIGAAIQVEADGSLYQTRAFADGLFEIQDYASQQIGLAAVTPDSKSIWDVCAGAGGKALQLATLLNGAGAVFCTDIRKHALEECKRRAGRHGLNNMRTQLWDGLSAPELPKALREKGGFDVVFVDAPCSSSGTWRRNPESRYRNSGGTIAEFQSVQLRLLKLASSRLRSGGRLVYATCSWLPQENEGVVEQFVSDSNVAFGNFVCKQMNMVGLPHKDSDAMFVAVLEKS